MPARHRLIIAFLIILFLSSACQGLESQNHAQESGNDSAPTLSTQVELFTPAVTQTTPLSTISKFDPPQPTVSPTPTPIPVTTLLFTGVIVPARCVQAALDTSGNPDYPYEEVKDLIQSADLAIGTFNATMSEVPPHTGCVPTYVLVGSPENADALQRAGFDAMSVATNHIKDCGLTNCGDRAFFDTLDNLHRVNIQTVGAGKNLEESLRPIVLTANGVRYGIVSQGQIEQGGVYAAEGKPGIAPLTQENIIQGIQLARSISDVVIFMPHWGPENMAQPNWIQRNLAQFIVESGADVVVGNHTHVVQGIQQINGVWVFYGLGNFVFDQWQRDHQQGVILLVRFQGTQFLNYELIPTHVDKDGRVHLADEVEAAEILERIQQASQNLR